MRGNLILVRHGESLTNAKVPVKSEYNNFLTQRGVLQALHYAGSLEKALNPDSYEVWDGGYPGLDRVDVILSSTLPRAYQTAMIYAGVLRSEIEIHQLHGLRERTFFGEGIYKSREEIVAELGPEKTRAIDDELDFKPSELGETQREVYDRVTRVFNEEIADRLNEGQNVMVVTHFYVLRALVSHILVGSPEMMPSISFENAEFRIFQSSD